MEKEDGFETQISKFNTKLSGGEMQRIAIARVILQNPSYLIMDEATSGIDLVNEKEIVDSLKKLMKGKTVVMISHDMDMIRKADNIVVLNEGKIEACGNYENVLENSSLFQSFQERSVS